MRPIQLETPRLVLDQPTDSDVDRITEYCRDPVFEHTMATPWPYEREHATAFVREVVPDGWASDAEYTWAIRRERGGELLGVIGVRPALGDVGFWIGAPHRGRGFAPEAIGAACDFAFDALDWEVVRWEARVGNVASARAAEKAGFAFIGTALGRVPGRDGAPERSWLAELRRGDSRAPKPGWPR